MLFKSSFKFSLLYLVFKNILFSKNKKTRHCLQESLAGQNHCPMCRTNEPKYGPYVWHKIETKKSRGKLFENVFLAIMLLYKCYREENIFSTTIFNFFIFKKKIKFKESHSSRDAPAARREPVTRVTFWIFIFLISKVFLLSKILNFRFVFSKTFSIFFFKFN